MKKKNSIITMFVLIVVVLLAIVLACFFALSKIKLEQKIINSNNNTQNNPTTDNVEKKLEGTIIEGSEFNTYRNEKFGFEFKFPKDWSVRENVFKSATTKFNMVIEPINGHYLPYPIRINILPVEWIETVTKNMTEVKRVSIDGVNAIAYSITSEGLPQIDYIFPLRENRIAVGAKIEYEDILNQVLKSFKFIK